MVRQEACGGPTRKVRDTTSKGRPLLQAATLACHHICAVGGWGSSRATRATTPRSTRPAASSLVLPEAGRHAGAQHIAAEHAMKGTCRDSWATMRRCQEGSCGGVAGEASVERAPVDGVPH